MLRRLTSHLRYIVPSIFGIIVVLTAIFVLQNFNKTLDQAEQVLLLKQQVATVSINQEMWQEVVARLNSKLNATSTSVVADPF